MAEFFHAHSALLANVCGFAAMLTGIITYQFKKHRAIMLLLVLCSLLWCCHYACLGLFTPVAMNAMNILKNTVFCFRDRAWTKSPALPGAFIALSLVMTILTWQNGWSLLPFVGASLSTVAQWQTDTKKLKRISVPSRGVWLAYNCISRSWAGVCTEAFALGSIAVSLFRLRQEEKHKAQMQASEEQQG